MKKVKIIVILFLYFFTSHLLFAKEIFIDESSGKEYLFLGSVEENQKKWLDLKNNKIEWIENSKLQQQSGQLTPEEFFEKIIKSGLIFYADGAEPFWNATISENKLNISISGEKEQELAIKMEMDKKPLDGVFLLMFQSKDHEVYGLIRKLWWDTPCDISVTDETSTFEVFINYRGKIVKGCARLDKK
ncbi:hypothetical protein [Entomomonas asaccharolytica]|uniref:Uncharacterized protein n=1 Tax=Entomomonas asaccharolytica TaxID=2785331 RepID=A0A974RXQ5_9GAMM|nr:hypothetical protein [Entomomonas asaccharolytica]QQP86493.1 hypothetical protein JHT90_04430 [Entomomonas asaccharolytica]